MQGGVDHKWCFSPLRKIIIWLIKTKKLLLLFVKEHLRNNKDLINAVIFYFYLVFLHF